MAFSLLGTEWWSWEAGGSFQVDDRFDVRVVVYQSSSREEVATLFPTVKGRSDYRLITRDDALRYLDEKIAELVRWSAEADKDDDIDPLLRQLKEVRETILICLPAAPRR